MNEDLTNSNVENDDFVIHQPEFVIKLGNKNKLQMGYNASSQSVAGVGKQQILENREAKRLEALKQANLKRAKNG